MMTNLPGRDVNRAPLFPPVGGDSIPCGRCCPPPGQRVRYCPQDDQSLLTERIPEALREQLSAEDIAENGDRVLRLRGDGRCEFLSLGNTHCLLVDGDTDRRPRKCQDEGWPLEECANLDCPKLREP